MGLKKELVEKAKKYEIDYEQYETDEELEKAIKEYEEDHDDDNDDDNDDVEVLKEKLDHWKKEAKKAFDDRDAAKKERRAVQKKVRDLEKSLKNNPSKEDYDELVEQFEELKTFKEDLDKKKEEEERNKLDEVERLKLDHNKEVSKLQKDFQSKIDELNKKIEEKDSKLEETRSNVHELRKTRLQNDIMKVATKYNAYSPEQIHRILSNEFNFDEDLGKHVHYIRDEKGKVVDEKTVEERVAEFLQDETNANLVKSTKKSGTNHDENPRYPNNDKKNKSKYDPKDPKIIEKADDKGLTPEDYIYTLEMRDERLAKVKGKE